MLIFEAMVIGPARSATVNKDDDALADAATLYAPRSTQKHTENGHGERAQGKNKRMTGPKRQTAKAIPYRMAFFIFAALETVRSHGADILIMIRASFLDHLAGQPHPSYALGDPHGHARDTPDDFGFAGMFEPPDFSRGFRVRYHGEHSSLQFAPPKGVGLA